MSVRVWAIKPKELKGLSRTGLLLLSARCALRVEPWVPPGAHAAWCEGLEFVLDTAFGEPTDANAARMRARTLRGLGASACNRLEATDEPLGRCMNYATSTLAETVEATTFPLGPALKKSVIEAAKLSASIPAVLAHAGRVGRTREGDGVDVACLAAWQAIRADIELLARASDPLGAAGDPIATLRELAPLWLNGRPDWAMR